MKFTEKEIGALNQVVYMMNYIDGDLYQENLFPENFCIKFQKLYSKSYQPLIRQVLGKISSEDSIDFLNICIGIPPKYSNNDVLYYVSLFRDKLMNCSD
jgi:hypothetical protein